MSPSVHTTGAGCKRLQTEIERRGLPTGVLFSNRCPGLRTWPRGPKRPLRFAARSERRPDLSPRSARQADGTRIALFREYTSGGRFLFEIDAQHRRGRVYRWPPDRRADPSREMEAAECTAYARSTFSRLAGGNGYRTPASCGRPGRASQGLTASGPLSALQEGVAAMTADRGQAKDAWRDRFRPYRGWWRTLPIPRRSGRKRCNLMR